MVLAQYSLSMQGEELIYKHSRALRLLESLHLVHRGTEHEACLAVISFPKASVKVKSSGGGGTFTSSHEAPHVLCMLTGAELAAAPSKALCTEGQAQES